VDGTKGHDHHLETDTLSKTQLVKTNKRIGDEVGAMNVENHPGSSILDRLEPSDARRRKAEEDTIKMIEPQQHQRRHQGYGRA
jgi:oligoribonuclease (3'-5' exoribonuclease)